VSKSLRKAKKERQGQVSKLTQNLHLVGGKLDHNITHSHAPISASEIEKLEAINPEYAKELIGIMKNSIKNDGLETELFYKAVDKEQDNDRRSIDASIEIKKEAMKTARYIITGFILLDLICLALGQYELAAAITTVGLVGVVRAIFLNKKEEDE